MLKVLHSALKCRLDRFISLSDSEVDFIATLEKDETRHAKGYRLINIGDKSDKIFILKSGWAVLKSYSKLRGSQILRIYLPGEVIGFSELGSLHATHQVIMQTEGIVSAINGKELYQNCPSAEFLGPKAA